LGVIHRDLKPENLFVTRQPDGSELLKVIDFGISKRLDTDVRSYTLQGQSLGSPQYMAPEQMASPDKVDARADIWSLGVVLFELLTNKVPFGGETIPVACVKVLCDEPTSLRALRPELPAELEEVVRRCLRKHPDERYPSVKELAQALVPFASAECAESLGRVRRILSPERASDGARSSLRSLSEERDWTNDSTPVPSARTTTDVDFRVPTRPLWPAALLVAGVASLLILTQSDPQVLWQMTQIAGRRVESAARAGAQAVSGLAQQATSFVLKEKEELGVKEIGVKVVARKPTAVPATSAHPVSDTTLVAGSPNASKPPPAVPAPSVAASTSHTGGAAATTPSARVKNGTQAPAWRAFRKPPTPSPAPRPSLENPY
jgi:serine/threonine-protein kinase